MGKFLIKKAANGFKFGLLVANDEIILNSEIYSSEAACRAGIESIKKMITKQQEKHGWEFLFLGANIDAVAEAERVGIKANRAVSYCADSLGTDMNFAAVNNVACAVRKSETVHEDWKKEIEEYVKKQADQKK